MKQNQKIALVVIIGIIGGYFILSKSSRGVRNNNPGNIRKTGDKWQGLKLEQTDPAFFQFISPIYGIRALAKILRNYQELHHLVNVKDIINRYAPPSENDSRSYIMNVSDKMGVSPFDTISLDDETQMFKMVSAIILHENGYNPYDVESTIEAIRMV